MTKSEEKDILVLYHAHCMDGYAAAWAAWKTLADRADYQAVRHQTPIPGFSDGAELYILDFCYSMKELVAAAKKASKIVVLDHHISAQKEFERYKKHSSIPSNLEIKFVQEHSGCMITWQYFQGDQEPPLLLSHIEDHDLWRHQLTKTEEITKALYLRLPLDFSDFEKIKLAELKQEGAILVTQQQLNISRLLKAQHSIVLNNKQGLAVNAPSMFSSDLGHALAEQSGSFGLTYYYHGKRQCYECSLRSIGDFDVSELARELGGGGHKNAAGFSIDQKTFLSFL